jgi:hypothetical protein
MKLIIQNINNELYAYVETEKHYQKVKSQRPKPVHNPKEMLDNECFLPLATKPGDVLVFRLGK